MIVSLAMIGMLVVLFAIGVPVAVSLAVDVSALVVIVVLGPEASSVVVPLCVTEVDGLVAVPVSVPVVAPSVAVPSPELDPPQAVSTSPSRTSRPGRRFGGSPRSASIAPDDA